MLNPSACPTAMASPASWIVRRRTSALSAMSLPPSPVMAETPLPDELSTSLVQRSPQRFGVALALSIAVSIWASSSTRGVIRPCTSPIRNTV